MKKALWFACISFGLLPRLNAEERVIRWAAPGEFALVLMAADLFKVKFAEAALDQVDVVNSTCQGRFHVTLNPITRDEHPENFLRCNLHFKDGRKENVGVDLSWVEFFLGDRFDERPSVRAANNPFVSKLVAAFERLSHTNVFQQSPNFDRGEFFGGGALGQPAVGGTQDFMIRLVPGEGFNERPAVMCYRNLSLKQMDGEVPVYEVWREECIFRIHKETASFLTD